MQVNQKEKIVEPGNCRGEVSKGWSGVMSFMRFVDKPDASGWDEQRSERILRQVLWKVETRRARRQVMRAFAAGASAVVLVGLLLRMVGVDLPWPARPSVVLADKAVSGRLVR